MKIEINNKWLDYNSKLYTKKLFRKPSYYQHFYNGVKFDKRIAKIKYVCKKCNKEVEIYFENFTEELCSHCKLENTNLKRYGRKNIGQFGTKEHDNAMIKKYGTKCLWSNSKWKKEKLQNKYGVDNAFQIPEVKEIIKEKYHDKLKDEEYNKQVIKKRKKTCLKKYGVEFIMQSNDIKEKVRQTNLERYGVDNPQKVEEIFIKTQKANKSGMGIKIYYTKFGNKIHYQSKSELSYIQECEKQNIKIWDGPTLKYILNEREHIYYCDFETEKNVIEIKGSHQYYKEALKTGEIEAKNKAAQKYAASINKEFLFLLDIVDYSTYV